MRRFLILLGAIICLLGNDAYCQRIQIHRSLPVVHVYMYEDFPRAKAVIYLNLIRKVYLEIRLEEKRLRLPAWAYYKPRKRYDASAILNHFEASLCKDRGYILGLTNKDIYMNKEGNGETVKWGIIS